MNIFFIIGLGVLLTVVALSVALHVLSLKKMKDRNDAPTVIGTPVIPTGSLGNDGVSCGGPERFPCGPGTMCQTMGGDWTKEYGTCIPDPAGAVETTPFR